MATTNNMSEQSKLQVDALWTLIQSQKKCVRKELCKRFFEENERITTLRYTENENKRRIRETLIPAFRDVLEAEKKGVRMPDAYDLLNELKENR